MELFERVDLPIVDDEGGNFFCRFKEVLVAVWHSLQMLCGGLLGTGADSLPSMATGCAERRREGFEKGEWEGKRSQEALLRESSGPMGSSRRVGISAKVEESSDAGDGEEGVRRDGFVVFLWEHAAAKTLRHGIRLPPWAGNFVPFTTHHHPRPSARTLPNPRRRRKEGPSPPEPPIIAITLLVQPNTRALRFTSLSLVPSAARYPQRYVPTWISGGSDLNLQHSTYMYSGAAAWAGLGRAEDRRKIRPFSPAR
jgi:hypothetical protein